ncbi:nicotinate-nucleotide--dimethylbenzimidazole phosphoribosyltransferase [Desulfosporosinus fructosivorans]|uniref:Nicotinate-nucleotide--dimethylbenzimidazole phosphoribosyltransferase n=1 Tax=Desulfosporosinus fructosivorans TaxID=2018669 RepID=A0A4Z0R280_9FIRM|nr:nicotinate-nucleotide--dimethylbenzimidazole phosphoribosyltransferase [Desulfosporosinus fructosivorans]TGE36253.1 nicotinate-nucleotide--dimethylbenzimidazole phosphoribosyltransferase [Desulfosporosinus fructosivorans]
MDNLTVAQLNAQLETITKNISDLDEESVAQIQKRLDSLTKPLGSLGQLESLAKQLGGIQRTSSPKILKKAILLMAGDHGVAAEGVSAFPQEVTPQMVYNIIGGGAAINVLARQANAEVFCTDVGVAFPLEGDIIHKRVANGTQNMAKGPAMTRQQALQALLVGAEVADEKIRAGFNLLGTGDLGIGNTTPSSAIVALITNSPIESVVGRGTGIDDAGLIKKRRVIEKAIELNQPDPQDALDVLAKVGGLEIAAIAGSILQAAASRVPIVIDGFISTAGALIAAKLAPKSTSFMIPSHGSVEIGHRKALAYLGLDPVLNLNMRLGEGTGAALTFHLVEAALHIIEEMSTFADAGVSEQST